MQALPFRLLICFMQVMQLCLKMLKNIAAIQQQGYKLIRHQIDLRKNAPIQSVFERYVQLKGCSYIDEIIPYLKETEVEDILLTYNIDIRFIGEEYKDKYFSGKQICEDKGIEIHYNSRKHSFSSSGLRKRIQEAS